ncbi:MAG: hypothetical protein ABIP16_07925 [Thermomonas sp.]
MANNYNPNQIPRTEQFINILYAAFIIALGVIGLMTGNLLLPGKRIGPGSGGLSLHGLTAWFMGAAMVCACVVLLSTVVDHYDRRDNEVNYQRIARVGKVLGWSLFAIALALHLIGIGV